MGIQPQRLRLDPPRKGRKSYDSDIRGTEARGFRECVCVRWRSGGDDGVIDGDAGDKNNVVEFTTKWPKCLTILKMFDILIMGMIINNMKGEKL